MEENQDSQPQQNDIPAQHTRRKFLGGLGAIVGTYFASKFVHDKVTGQHHKHQEAQTSMPDDIPLAASPSNQPPKDYVPSPDVLRIDAELLERPSLNKILDTPLLVEGKHPGDEVYNPARAALEMDYASNVENLTSINRGFWVCGYPDARMKLLDARFSFRLQGREYNTLRPLSAQERQWARDNKIHPEVFATALEQYDEAVKLVDALRHDVRPDLKNYDVSRILLNPGAVAELICRETGATGKDGLRYGFANIGTRRAMTQINDKPDAFPEDKNDLRELANRLSEKYGLHYNPDNLPGSEWFDKPHNKSGGAIAMQFMPENALMLSNMFQKVRREFNPWDIDQGTLGVYLFLAIRSEFGKGLPDELKRTIDHWNQWKPEEDAIMNASASYARTFSTVTGPQEVSKK